MGISRDISLPTHAVVELMLGLIAMIAPAAVGASAMGVVTGVVLGATLMGLAMSGIGVLERREDRPAMAVDLHRAADRFVEVALIAAAALLVLTGDTVTGLIFAGIAAADRALELSTRYRAPA
jgi:hypothetical protein